MAYALDLHVIDPDAATRQRDSIAEGHGTIRDVKNQGALGPAGGPIQGFRRGCSEFEDTLCAIDAKEQDDISGIL